ncbi:30S ribosome-binding factor RbfA [Kordiimonas sp. SCSIO 12610]|uniref:30S ribosome-binding factor RbfA n=1 Tax=Kordiimonas sp. SCSIO 12610 TaxID=2829597 RepID=UPI00210AB2D9|nr:30S ribosome-binding factor RbfA [Kordiimonas sp. SCSIO 12610]UTW55101.1 30S ribosome-binding factor RbfA [Kordiimonas sp. SCSIO 12610]
MGKSDHTGSGGPSLRLLRVGENIRHAISTVLMRGDVQDQDLNGVSVSVSEVRVSPDLRNATVFVMPLGGDPDTKITKALNRNSPHIRGLMSKMVHMKYMPRLKFLLDESFDEASHIETLLRDPRVSRDLDHSDDGTPSEEE